MKTGLAGLHGSHRGLYSSNPPFYVTYLSTKNVSTDSHDVLITASPNGI